MRYILTSTLVGTALLLATPASARNNFENTISAPVNNAVKIEVIIGEDLAYRAENLPKKLSDRGSRFSRGFGAHGNYGTREITRLQERLQEKLTRQLTRKGVEVSEQAPTVLRVTLTDARPNRPTFKQLSKEAGLSFQSFGVGGAEMEAELLAAGGGTLGNMSYKWYENDIRDARYGGTWSDAHRSFDRFARRAAKALTG